MTGRVLPTESSTTSLEGAARIFGVSPKTFRDRFMSRIPALDVSAPGARRRHRRFSVEALREALRMLGTTVP